MEPVDALVFVLYLAVRRNFQTKIYGVSHLPLAVIERNCRGTALEEADPTVQSAVGTAMALLIATMASGLLIGAPMTVQSRVESRVESIYMGLHDLSAKGMDGTDIDLKTLAGKKVIALNVASK